MELSAKKSLVIQKFFSKVYASWCDQFTEGKYRLTKKIGFGKMCEYLLFFTLEVQASPNEVICFTLVINELTRRKNVLLTKYPLVKICFSLHKKFKAFLMGSFVIL